MSTGHTTSQVWKVSFKTPITAAEAFATLLSDAFHPASQAVATAEVEEHVSWSVEAYYEEEPDTEQIENIIRPLADELDIPLPNVTVEVLPDINWVAKSLEGLAPIETDRFFVHGAHDADKCPAARHPLLVDAGEAFGTGHHGTTLGCLKFIEKECQKRRPARVLDLGCGSGLLAIAAAKLTGREVIASDIDPIATRVTRENARMNMVHPLIRTITAKGTDHPDLKAHGPYDLLIANILAGPLASMAPDVEQQLARGGTLILSGILHEQEQMVLSAYRCQGLFLLDRLRIDEWVTLRLQG